MKDQLPHTIALDAAKVAFLESLVAKYDLADTGKAVRCLVDYARDHPERLEEIFTEVRCHDC